MKTTVVYLGRDPGLAVGSRAGVTVAEIEAALERMRTDRALHRGLIDRWKRPHDGWRSRAVTQGNSMTQEAHG